MLEILWGLKTEAMFDVWSFEHIIAGASLGALVALKNKKMFAGLYTYLHQHIPDKSKISIIRHKYEIVVVALISYIWESVEFYGEIGQWGVTAQRWFYGIEYWQRELSYFSFSFK